VKIEEIIAEALKAKGFIEDLQSGAFSSEDIHE